MASTNTHVDAYCGTRIRQERLRLGLTQRDLSSDGLTYAYVSRIESGQRRPSISAVITLAEMFRRRAHEIVEECECAGEHADAFLWQQYAHDMTALYLMSGSSDGACLLCGRHEHTGGTSDDERRHERRHNGARGQH